MQNRLDRYSQQFYLVIGESNREQLDDHLSLFAFETKWAINHNDRGKKLIRGATVLENDHPEDDKFAFLAEADANTRIVIHGRHQTYSEYFKGAFDDSSIHFKKIIDIIRYHARKRDVLLNAQRDCLRMDRALRIKFISCNVGNKPKSGPSIAEKIFDYASNHYDKSLRIELSVGNMMRLMAPCDRNVRVPGRKDIDCTKLHSRFMPIRFINENIASRVNSHKKRTLVMAHLIGIFADRYRPSGYKTVLKVDPGRSRHGHVFPRSLTADEDRAEMQAHDRARVHLSWI